MKVKEKVKNLFLEMVSKRPLSTIIFVIIVLMCLGFFLTTTIYFGYENGQLKIEVKKKELNINDSLKK